MKQTMQERESIGPFKAAGIALSTIGTVAIVADDTIRSAGSIVTTTLGSVNSIIEDGATAIRITTSGMIKDMEVDAIIDDAHRVVRREQALAEAARLIAGIPKPSES